MEIRFSIPLLAIWCGLLLVSVCMGADRIDAGQLLTSDQLKGAAVHTPQGERIGTVDEVILDVRERRIAYVVVTSGGFWGIGGDQVVIPWTATSVQQVRRLEALEPKEWKRQPGVEPGVQGSMRQEGDDQMLLVLDIDRETLMSAPRGEVQNLDRRQAERIHRYYGVHPYWD